MRGASLGGLLVGPESGGGVRRRVALHEELAAARGAPLLQHAVLRGARAHGVPRHRQPRYRVVRAARRAARARRALLEESNTCEYITRLLQWLRRNAMLRNE